MAAPEKHTLVDNKKRYALSNYIEVINFYKLPWNKRMFAKAPAKQLIDL